MITPEVEALRDEFHLPGMRILQFGFSTGPEAEKHLPHRFVPHCIVYTGTHDNDTSRRLVQIVARPDDAVARRRSRPSAPSPCGTSAPGARSSTGT